MTNVFTPRGTAVALAIMIIFGYLCNAAEGLRIEVPTVLPRNLPLGAYSPRISFSYSDLKSGPYTVKVWLLEPDNWNCASTCYCEQSFAINNGGREGFADGTLRMASPFDVYDYGPSLIWVARLFDASGVEVASTKIRSKTVSEAPPILKPIGKRVGVVGQELRLAFSTSDSTAGKVTYRVHDAPAEAKLDPETGVFKWTPTTPGLFRITAESVSDNTQLSDSEIVALDIAQAEAAPAPIGSPNQR